MTIKIVALLVSLVLLRGWVGGVALEAQSLRGRLIDRSSEGPVVGGAVTLMGADSVSIRTVITNEIGAFHFTVPGPGTYRLSAQRIGYAPSASPIFEVRTGGRSLDLYLVPQVIALAPIEVRATPARPTNELGGFYQRQVRRPIGTFITRDQFERWDPGRLSDILLGAGVRVEYLQLGGMRFYTGQGCLNLVIDGVRIPSSFATHPDELVNARDIEGIEIYKNYVQVPSEFVGAFNQCGAIIVWTQYSR